MSQLKTALLVGLLLFITGCKAETENVNRPQTPNTVYELPRISTVLPAVAELDADSCQGREALSECDWMHGAEAVFFATVNRVSLDSTTPCIYTPNGWVEDSNGALCSSVLPSLIFNVSVEKVLTGPLQVPESIEISIGPDQYENWSPKPVDDDGVVSWVVNAPLSGRSINVGDRIGFAAYQHESGTWALLGEPMFNEGEAGYLEFQQFGGATCTFKPPSGLGEVLTDDLENVAKSCETTSSAIAYRQSVAIKLQGNGECSSYAFGPRCGHSLVSSFGCTGDETCNDGTVCIEGTCR